MKILASILLIFCVNNCNSQTFNKISKEIYKHQYVASNKILGMTAERFYKIRSRLLKIKNLSFIDKSDTFFLIESSSIVSNRCFGKIWNNYGKIEYVENDGEFDFDINSIYTAFMCKLVQNWDTLSIRHEENIHNILSNGRSIIGTRVIKNNSNYTIECIVFGEFFLYERDIDSFN